LTPLVASRQSFGKQVVLFPAADEVTLSVSYCAAALLRECSPEDYTAIAAAGGTRETTFNNKRLFMNWCFVLVYWLAFGDFVLMRCSIRSEIVSGCCDAFQ
jgi:hypothetical protein